METGKQNLDLSRFLSLMYQSAHRWGFWISFIGVAAFQTWHVRHQQHHGDFGLYHQASLALFDNHSTSVYASVPGYIYPIFFAIIFHPLTLLPYWIAAFLWDVMRWIAFGACLVICCRLWPPARSNWMGKSLPFVLLAIMFRPMWNDSVNGNVNSLLLLPVLLGWAARSKRWPATAGAMWALAASIKPIALSAVLSSVGDSRGKIARCWAAFAVGGISLNIVLPCIVVGIGPAWMHLSGYSQGLTDVPVYLKFSNQSLSVGLIRILHHVSGGALDFRTGNGLRLFWFVAAAMVGAWLLLVFSVSRRRADAFRDEGIFAACCMVTALLSPVVWMSHLLWTLPCICVLLRGTFLAGRKSLQVRVLALTALAVLIWSAKLTWCDTLVWSQLCLAVALTDLLFNAPPLSVPHQHYPDGFE